MTPFLSIALFKRAGAVRFRPPRKEHGASITQARKAASRFWSGTLPDTDTLLKIIVAREIAGRLEISERDMTDGRDKPWVEYSQDVAHAAKEAHLAAILSGMGIDPASAPPPVPDVLIVNGFVYRREI